MNPDTLHEVIQEEQMSNSERATVQDYVDSLYNRLIKLDLTDQHRRCMAHRAIDLIAKIQEFHRDLDLPDTSKTMPSFTDFFGSLLKKKEEL